MTRPKVSSVLPEPENPLANRNMLYVIGAQRAGTTWLHSLFIKHPQLQSPGHKEVHYWDTVRPPYLSSFLRKSRDELDWLSNSGPVDRYRRFGARGVLTSARIMGRLTAKYEALSDQGHSHCKYAHLLTRESRIDQILVDNTPSYCLLNAGTFGEMSNVCHSAKFLFVLRDPADRLWSGLGLYARNALDVDRQRIVNAAFEAAMKDEESLDVARSDYARTIQELERAIHPDQTMYVFFEKLFQRDTTDAIYKFVGLQPIEPNLERRVNSRRPRLKLEPHVRKAAKERLSSVYEFVEARFGDEMPDAWKR